MIEWFNQSQGFLITILTLVYVVTTILIQNSNRQSASAAAKSNKQQLALQLLDHRLNAYYLLSNWVSTAKSLFIENFPLGTATDFFTSLLYSTANDPEIESLTDQLNELQQKLASSNNTHSIQIQHKEKFERIFQTRFFKRFRSLDRERQVIGQIEVLFPFVDFTPIDLFCRSFFDAFMNGNEKNIESLKVQYNEFVKFGTLEMLWKTLKEI